MTGTRLSADSKRRTPEELRAALQTLEADDRTWARLTATYGSRWFGLQPRIRAIRSALGMAAK